MRIAHVIMVHKNPDQLIRLIKRLYHPDADFYIHIDSKSEIGDFESVRSIKQVSFIKNRINCNWGGNSLLTGIITAMNEVLSLNKGYNFINMLSAQDYPIMSPDKIHSYLKNNLERNFISYESDDSTWWKQAAGRYEKYHFTDLDFIGKYFIERMANIFLPKRKFPIPVKLYGGCKSTWWTITEDCARYISSQLSNNKKLNNFLKFCWGTDEFIVATLIMSSPYKDVTVNNNLRYIDWSEGNARPKLLKMDDFDDLKHSEMLFARKFDMDVDSAVLERIDQELLTLKHTTY